MIVSLEVHRFDGVSQNDALWTPFDRLCQAINAPASEVLLRYGPALDLDESGNLLDAVSHQTIQICDGKCSWEIDYQHLANLLANAERVVDDPVSGIFVEHSWADEVLKLHKVGYQSLKYVSVVIVGDLVVQPNWLRAIEVRNRPNVWLVLLGGKT